MAVKSHLSVVRFPRRLSARLLVLAILAVLVGEMIVYALSIVRFCETYLLERITAARLAT